MTVSVEAIGALLCEAAQALDLTAVVQHDGGEWDVVFADERIVDVTWLADTGVLGFETALGVPETSDLLALRTMLLEYNYLWRETGGLRMALDRPDGCVHLGFSLGASVADVALMINVLGNFHAAANAWGERLQKPNALPVEGMMQGFLRV